MIKIIRRALYYFVGSVCLALGISFAIKSGLGSGAFDAMNYSIANVLNTSVGNAMYLSLFTLFALSMLLKPKFSYVFGFLLSLMTGFFVNFWLGLLQNPVGFSMQGLYFSLALLFSPFGIVLMIRSKMPLSPMDTLMLILVDLLKKSVAFMKTSMEATYVVIAVILGYFGGIGTGTISMGTLVITLLIGPLMEVFMSFIKEVD